MKLNICESQNISHVTMCGHKPIGKLNENLKFEELNDSASCYLAPPLVNCSDEKFLSADLETKDSDPLF